MGAVLGLGAGLGLLLIWSAWWTPREPARSRNTPYLRRLLDEAGWSEVKASGLLAVCGAAGLVALLAILVASRTLPVALAFGGIAAYSPVALLKGRARRRQRDLAEVWPEAVDNLASAVRAGMSLPEALTALSLRGPEPLREPFARFAVEYQVGGNFSDCIDRLKARLADPVGDRVVEALRVAREVGGGDLGRLLRSLSGYLRDEARTRGELESRQSWTVNGARLAVAAPWLVLLFLCFQPDVIARYSTPAGIVVLAGGAVACVTAYRLMVRLGRLPTERRILA